MKLSTFIAASKACSLRPGNYILKSKQTGTLFWFMVGSDYDKTLKSRYEIGTKQYKEYRLYRQICVSSPWVRKEIKRLYASAKQILRRK